MVEKYTSTTKNSILHNDFNRLEIGTGVNFSLEQGEQ
jgi:hypothetical protein